MTDRASWIQTEATVTSCRFQFARLNTLRLGLQSGEKYRITFNYFNYYAHGRLYFDEFQSPTAITQNSLLALTYNPLHPEQNSYTSGLDVRPIRALILAFGIPGSIVISLLWLAALRGCS